MQYPEQYNKYRTYLDRLDEDEITDLAEEGIHLIDDLAQYQELMMMYNCAVNEMRTKLGVLNADLSSRYQRNPIEFISYRIKKPASLFQKLEKKGLPFTIGAIENNINDVAGVRVICSFIDDIYAVASMLMKQDDITLVETKDYIRDPKPNGYRSLHLILEIPVFFSDRKKNMRVEVQIRTIAMDFWASLEHQLKYKKHIRDEEAIVQELTQCAETIAATDQKMMEIRNKIDQNTDSPSGDESLVDKLARFEVPII